MLPDTIYISRNGQMLGSFPRDAIKAGLTNGTYFPDDLAWHEGAPGWAPLRTLEGFAPAPAPAAAPASPAPAAPVPPPIPAAAAPPVIPSAPPASPMPAPTPASSAVPAPPAAVSPKKRGCAGLLIFLILFGLGLAAGGFVSYKFGLPYLQLLNLQRKAESGDTKAALTLGWKYRDGDNTKQNLPEAIRWFRKASDAGNTQGTMMLAHMLLWNHPALGPRQPAEALQLYLKACDKLDAGGCESAASIYETGAYGLEKNPAEARRLKARAEQLATGKVQTQSMTAPTPPVITATVKPSSSGTEVPAAEFYRAFTTNASQADALYKDKTITLVGAVDTAAVNPMGQVFVLLKAGGPNYVTCLFPASAKGTVTALHENQPVKIRGQCTGIVYGTFSLKDCSLVQ